MAKPIKRLEKNKVIALSVAIVLLMSSFLIIAEKFNFSFVPTWNDIFIKAKLVNETNGNFDFKITFLDVGQGDCAIIQSKDFVAMIDGGEAENAEKIVAFLQKENVDVLNYVFATHPHSDHIGSIPQVLEKIKCENFVIPHLQNEIVPTTQVYANLLNSVKASGASAVYSKLGQEIIAGDCKITVIGPVQQENELNDTSLVLLVKYRNKSFLFTGDMEDNAEKHLLKKGEMDLNVDVLKAGHHGSKTSSSQELIDVTSPKYSVVSCGSNNIYDHPNSEFLERAERNSMIVYRTDMQGNVTCNVQDDEILFTFEKGA